MQIKALDNQTLLDLSIYLFGTAVGALELAIENNIALTDDIEAGQELEIPKNYALRDSLVAEYFQNEQLKPATGMNGLEIIVPEDFGIGLMVIEESFIIR
ncbi:hypothetical protein SAMN05443634_104101 [Chishuiella changwenlii]|jgi:hypothetical protein|uniref:LysM domain-containing protein n=1 Tax=Chishuiella changwenlii TaxID=1434701 RepID=A0A1M6VZR0_9FLAO|nr:hypothetical protein [Chishuiella changwenlii]GGE89473.1 hypothetical protein GCM10010984_03900 [Chishuiella changwenlii]SHK86898.1 hypothetical protein SAMN05443634_104101 [Chishuiella changwenlii]